MKSDAITVPPLPLQVEDRRFLELFHRLRPYGGMLSDDELQCMHIAKQTNVVLGRALLNRELMALQWRHRLWLPVFQFDVGSWQISADVSAAVAELFPVMQGYDLVEWFLTPNAWLRHRRPIDLLQGHSTPLHQAAQVERFLLSF